MLTLIVSNADLSSQTLSLTTPHDSTPFTTEVRVKGPYLYLMTAQDPSHYLSCDLTLEVEQNHNGNAVICHFPKINDEQLEVFIDEDATLYEIAMTQFQMKILEQLLLFCVSHYASKLVIYTDEAQAGYLEIYKSFLNHEVPPFALNLDPDEMIIPTNSQTFEKWITFMDQTILKFRQTLWQGQRNPTIKQYLKYHPLG